MLLLNSKYNKRKKKTVLFRYSLSWKRMIHGNIMILDIAAPKELVPRPQISKNLKYLKMVSSFLWEIQRNNESRFALLLFMTSFLLHDSIFSKHYMHMMFVIVKLWMKNPSFCVKMKFNFCWLVPYILNIVLNVFAG